MVPFDSGKIAAVGICLAETDHDDRQQAAPNRARELDLCIYKMVPNPFMLKLIVRGKYFVGVATASRSLPWAPSPPCLWRERCSFPLNENALFCATSVCCDLSRSMSVIETRAARNTPMIASIECCRFRRYSVGGIAIGLAISLVGSPFQTRDQNQTEKWSVQARRRPKGRLVCEAKTR